MTTDGWTSADSWVLTAVAISGPGADLRTLIASGDACNHAILERSEIERGLGRLAASGLVRLDLNLRVTLSKAGERITAEAEGGVVERLLQMERCLRDVPLRHGHIAVTAEEYNEALERYKSRR